MVKNPIDSEVYNDREQTLVKHEVLKSYLLPFALVIGTRYPSITYVDTFSGPWNARTSDFQDTSFGIAINQLNSACRQLGSMKRDVPKLRAFFIEKDRDAFEQLDRYLQTVTGIEIERRNADFADCVDEIVEFVQQDRRTFPFFLIDPKGWDIPLETIRSLLEFEPGESLIMFMTEFIRRFMSDERLWVCETFDRMYGQKDIRHQFEGLNGLDRDDAMLREYISRVQVAGGYKYASSVLVLHPTKQRTHFHLVYLTRHHVGIEKFKSAERKAMKTMEDARAEAEQRRDKKKGVRSLFGEQELPESNYYEAMRNRALSQMQTIIASHVVVGSQTPYEAIWSECMRLPLVWPTDVAARIVQLRKAGKVEIDGMKPRERRPKPGLDHVIGWLGPLEAE